MGRVSVQAMSYVLDHSEAVGSERLALLAIANHASADSAECWPSVALIAREARVSERTAQYALRKLESAGRIARAGTGPRGTVRWRFIFRPAADSTPGGADPAPLQDATQGGAICDAQGVQPVAPEPSRGTVTNHQDDDAGASAPRTVPAIWPPVAASLQRVPEWAAALMRGGEIACLALIESNTDVPWQQIAAAAVSSRLDPDAGITTNSPRQGLDMLLADHRSGRGTGAAARGPRRGRQQADVVDHYAAMRGTLG